MAAQRLVVDPDAMRGSARAYDSAGDAAAGILLRLNTALAAIGDCWGSDETGVAFAANYVESRDQLLAGIAGIGAMLHQIADGVRVSADSYEAADRAAAG